MRRQVGPRSADGRTPRGRATRITAQRAGVALRGRAAAEGERAPPRTASAAVPRDRYPSRSATMPPMPPR